MDLTSIRPTGETFPPLKALIHGVQGVGKTTLACTFEAPILVPVEDGLAAIQGVPAFPRLTTHQDAVDVIQALHGEHPYKTVVVDSLDWMEPLIHAQTCAVHAMGNIEEFGYGKGYVEALPLWREFLDRLDRLRARGMASILIAHSEIKKFDAPDSDPYDRYLIKLHKGASALVQEWADVIGFAQFETQVKKTENGFGAIKARGIGTGRRLLHVEEKPAYVAKNRYGMAPTIPLDWAALVQQIQGTTVITPEAA